MKANEILNKIKNIVSDKVELSEKIDMAEIKLENGTVLVAEAFESGNAVFIKTEDEKVALPIGEYELEDKTILVVTEEGLIDSIKDATEVVEEEEVEVEAETEDKDKEEMKYVTKEEFKSAVDEIKAMIDEKMGNKKEKEEMSEEVKKEELSAVSPSPVKHNPETVASSSNKIQYSKDRAITTQDRVFNKMFQNN